MKLSHKTRNLTVCVCVLSIWPIMCHVISFSFSVDFIKQFLIISSNNVYMYYPLLCQMNDAILECNLIRICGKTDEIYGNERK